MNITADEAPTTIGSTSGAATPGETLRVARQLAGLSQEDIASKLKLSPRQIAAIETGDWSALPERTFTRGFMRNYARLVGVDPDSLGLDQVASQPNASNQLKPTPAAIGEIVHEADRNGLSATRWVVPAVLIAALLIGVLYVKSQQWFGWDASKFFSASVISGTSGTSAASAASSTAAAKNAAAAKLDSAEKTDAGVVTPAFPNAASTAGIPGTPNTSSGAVIAPIGLPAATGSTATETAAANLAPVLPSPALLPAAGEKRISLNFKGKSWTEVRSKGDVIFSETATPGTREFNGVVPLSFTVGNASNVVVSIDGKPFDMTELTRNDVARFRVE